MSELTKAVICGHSLYWTTAYNNCVMCENATLRARCEAAENERDHYRAACASVGEADGHGWAETTKELRQQVADLTEKLAATTREVERYKSLLRTSCQDNIEEYNVACKPTCDSHGHEHDCPTAHPGLVYDELRQQLQAMTEERDRLAVYHEDDEPSWRHRAEKLEQQLATAQAEIGRLKEEVEKRKDQLTHKHPTW